MKHILYLVLVGVAVRVLAPYIAGFFREWAALGGW